MTHSRYIDFISAYCDRWCERCAFTERCSLFAVQRALALCADDDAEAMETATEERDRWGQAHNARVDATSIMQTARAYTVLAARWLRVESGSIKGQAGTGVRDALEIVEWDHFLITVKLRRALNGLEELARGEDLDEALLRHDANATAKLALLCIDRSETAWRTIAGWSDNEFASVFAEQLAQLRGEVEEQFPDARRIIRPGLDQEAV